MFRLTLKDLLSIVVSINTCVPNFSLSLLLYTQLLFERFALLLPPLILLCIWFRPTLIVLASIIYNHSACLNNVFVCNSMRYCHLNTSLFIVYLNHIFHHHNYFFSLSSGFGFDFKIIISLLFFFSFFLLFLRPPPPPPPPPLRHHYFGSLCCYYCFMCSLLTCRLAGTDCTNRQLPTILIPV